MVSLSKIDKFDQQIPADHNVVRGEVHMHHLLLFEEDERIGDMDEDVHLELQGK